jgi:hypothetical protein
MLKNSQIKINMEHPHPDLSPEGTESVLKLFPSGGNGKEGLITQNET